jgi:16S rRNA U516 pseudouridylate synthase RsuA-like enzyme
MVRTQIRLTEAQRGELRRLAAATGRSVAALIREAVGQAISSSPPATHRDRLERASRVAGKFASGSSRGSAEHDLRLTGAFRK